MGRGDLLWRLTYDRYQFRARYDRSEGGMLTDTRDLAAGNWAGTQLTYSLPRARYGALTLGLEASGELNAVQRTEEISPASLLLFDDNSPRRSVAVFAQDELSLSKRWTAYLGARFDDNFRQANSLSPRAALIFQQSPATVWKFLYGRSFRNPTPYELTYQDIGGSQISNQALLPERAQSQEIAVERKLSSRVTGTASAYLMHMRDYVESVILPDDRFQYRNTDSYRSIGFELETKARIWREAEAGASLAIQKTRNVTSWNAVPNSPVGLGKLRVAVPAVPHRLWVSGSASFVSSRATLAGDRLSATPLAGLTFTTERLSRNCDLQFGIRNLLDREYYDPAGGAIVVDRLRADGRSAFMKLIWHVRE